MSERIFSGAAPQGASTPAPDRARLWEALISDTGCRVVVVGADGRITFANDAAQERHGPVGGGSLLGTAVADLQPVVGPEWAGWVSRVQDSGRPVIGTGVVGGLRYRMVIRPLEATKAEGSPRPSVLIVARDAADCLEDGLHPAPPGAEIYRSRHEDFGPLSSLTDREVAVLRLIGEGLSTIEIAERLRRSVKTVEWHRASLGTKLGVTNRIELARLAIRSGLVSLGRGPLRPRRDDMMAGSFQGEEAHR